MKKILIISLCVIAAVSCQKSEIKSYDNQIRFITNIDTKATPSAFEPGDVMSIWAVEQVGEEKVPLQIGGNYINNEPLTFDGSKWNSVQPLYWSENPCDFYAVYPFMGNISSIDNQVLSVPADQNAAGVDGALSGYEAADIMLAKVEGVTRGDGSVRLDFYHKLAKCTVKLVKGEKFEGNIPEDVTVHLYNIVTDYVLNVAEGKLSKYPFGAKKTITMKKTDSQSFTAVVVPQNIELMTPLVEVTMGGIAYLLSYSLSFKPGYNHTIFLTLNTSPDQEMIEIAIDVDQENW